MALKATTGAWMYLRRLPNVTKPFHLHSILRAKRKGYPAKENRNLIPIVKSAKWIIIQCKHISIQCGFMSLVFRLLTTADNSVSFWVIYSGVLCGNSIFFFTKDKPERVAIQQNLKFNGLNRFRVLSKRVPNHRLISTHKASQAVIW